MKPIGMTQLSPPPGKLAPVPGKMAQPDVEDVPLRPIIPHNWTSCGIGLIKINAPWDSFVWPSSGLRGYYSVFRERR